MRFSHVLAGGLAAIALSACGAPAEEAEPAAQDAADEMAAPTVPPPSDAEEDIRHFLLQEYPDATSISYDFAWSDLNGDGEDEAIVYLGGPYFCGTGGCNLLVLTPAGPMWRKVGDVSVSRTPVSVLETSTSGWRDLTVAVSGGGGSSGTMILKFDGENYPSNASTAPEAPADAKGEELLPEMLNLKTVEPMAVPPEG
ncbi:hypothetical protein [Croceicoccus gelatinilyticus]|uniref:hypothetical protein n=1 Tax=Croceicoccus gelatinilyticus TaxID=2835536 RepID=UPI001BD10072|nr:hypothetical protein [Croceicoccus gelatinilyticus]MBS7670429.1 hypothetical protein [Croceicoccus gelatinilyticus]